MSLNCNAWIVGLQKLIMSVR